MTDRIVNWLSWAAVGAMLLTFGLAILLACLLGIGAIAWIGNHVALPGQLAEIEQLRADSAVVDLAQAEDVIGQVTQWNQDIATKRAWNDIWWAGWMIPDEWSSVELIEVPR